MTMVNSGLKGLRVEVVIIIGLIVQKRSSPLRRNNGTHLYPERTTLITEIEAARVQLKPETYIEWSMDLSV